MLRDGNVARPERRGILLALLLVLVPLSTATCAQERSDWRAMNEPMEPFRILGNLYYVGASDVTAFLIATPGGHVLIDGGFEETAPRIRESVTRLGFRIEDVRYLLNSHAHLDHAGGLAALKRWSRAQLLASAGDAPLLRRGGRGDDVLGDSATFPAVEVDRELADGDTLELGGTTLTARITAGHTPGCTSWVMELVEGTEKHLAVSVCSLSILEGVRLTERPTRPGIAEEYRRSFSTLRALPCELFLAAHGSFFGLQEKRRAQLAGAKPNPFLDPAGYRSYLDRAQERFRHQLETEAAQNDPAGGAVLSLAPAGEPGEPLAIRGTVRDASGRPSAGASLLVFHTDARGYYTPQDERTGRMDEAHARLRGRLTTGNDGRFEIRTIRPGGYPGPRRDVPESSPQRFIPAHIHLEVTAVEGAMRRVQLVFDDDPRMNAEWRRWAEEEGNPVLALERAPDGGWRGSCEIVLPR